MTFKEKVLLEHPEDVDESCGCGVVSCPFYYGYETEEESRKNCNHHGGFGCSYCWGREMPETELSDAVNHPEHYNREGSTECIDEMLIVFGIEPVMNFCLLNVWKYRYRAGQKDDGLEDLKKSDFYMKKYIELKGEL